jgi:iron complex transport system permease protein
MKNIENQKNALINRYHKQALKKLIILFICVAGSILIFGLLSVTTYNAMTLKEAYEIIINHILGNEYPIRTTEWWADFYIWNRAIPRGAVAIIAGASLAAAGTLMQSLMNNPLADPYSTGISSGACFGAVSAIIMGVSFNITASGNTIVFNAFIGSMIPAMIMIIISKKIQMTPATLILIGTALSYFFNSMVTYMMVTTDADTLHSAYLWQVGTLDNITWDAVPTMLIITIIGTAFTILMSKQLNIMALGDASAKTLGLDVEKFRVVCLTVMALMTASIVSYVGIIGFLGLVSPHLVRMIIGSDNRFVLPISMSVGAFLLILADYFAITLGIPVGVVMSVIGSPIFFALIVSRKKSYGAIY